MLESRPYQRSQYLVDRAYQMRFVTRMFAIIFTVANASLLIAMAILLKNMHRPELGHQSYVVAALLGAVVTLLTELILSIPIVYYLGVRQSHQVIGPLQRITRTLEAIGSGDFSQRLTVRQGDALEDLAKTINKMAESLQSRFPKSST